MMCALKDLENQDRVRVRLIFVPDEESEEVDDRSHRRGRRSGLGRRLRDHRRADRSAHRRRGEGRARDGDRRPRPRGALLDAVARRQRGAQGGGRFPQIETLRSRRESSRDVRPARRSTSAGSPAAMPSTRCPTSARCGSTSATCPARIPRDPRAGRAIRGHRDRAHAYPPAGFVSRHRPVRAGAARGGRRSRGGEAHSVGRDGASEAAAFIRAGIPAVEFGPAGAGHHGPEEWVSLPGCRAIAGRSPTSSALLPAVPARSARRRAGESPARGRQLRSVDGGRRREPVPAQTRGGALWRFLLACVLVIGCTAGTTAVAGLLQVKDDRRC